MKLPYKKSYDAIEFWKECEEILNMKIGIYDWHMHITFGEEDRIWIPYSHDYEVDDNPAMIRTFTDIILARCMDWLAERGVWLQPSMNNSIIGSRKWGMNAWDGPLARLTADVPMKKCIITAYKEAVTSVYLQELESKPKSL